jgi:hypothetical protein
MPSPPGFPRDFSTPLNPVEKHMNEHRKRLESGRSVVFRTSTGDGHMTWAIQNSLDEIDRTLGLSQEPVSLRFDGFYLWWDQGTSSTFWSAHSGTKYYWQNNEFSLYAQKNPNKGPIPEGTYRVAKKFEVRPDDKELRKRKTPPFWNYSEDAARAGRSEPALAFGDGRVELMPIDITAPGRYGFFIHGGERMGSHGCIKIMNRDDLNAFALLLQACRQDYVYLEVEYPSRFKRGRDDLDLSVPDIPGLPKMDITKSIRLPKLFRPLDLPEFNED